MRSIIKEINTRSCLTPGRISINVLTLFLFLLLTVILSGCESLSQPSNSSVEAHWDMTTSTLHLSGQSNPGDETVAIHDASNGDLLGKAIVNSDGSWSATSTVAACEVHVDLPSGKITAAVVDAPDYCTSNNLSSRIATINDIPTGVSVTANPETLSTIPNAVILNPPTDMVIEVGQALTFTGLAIGTAANQAVSYNWNFGGAAANSTVQNPGSVIFSRAGTYYVMLSVTNNLGIPDPTPAVRTIVVNDNNLPSGASPIPLILSPTAVNGSININVGQSLFFSGAATDSTGLNAFTFEWNFSGAVPNQFGATPGNINFTRSGSYLVTLNATNALGVRSTVPATVIVNVATTTAFNQAPAGIIISPPTDVTVYVGESLQFRASGRDPDGNVPLTYSWNFDGLTANIFNSGSTEGGTVTFNTPGIYDIELTVTDSLGAVDPNPSKRRITVINFTTQPPGNGTLNNIIISPPVDVTIAPGQSIFFSGQASPVNGVGPFQYFWDFDGAAPDSSLQTPGDITFTIPDQYIVQFFVIDVVGNVVGQPVTRTVTVVDPSLAKASIISPQNAVNYETGVAVNLVGKVDNANGFDTLSYSWKIRKVGGPTVYESNLLSPGSFTFTQAGEYRIRFTVTGIDAFGNQTIESVAKSKITVSDPLIVNNTAIAFPAQDMFVAMGQSVNFQPYTVNGSNVRYEWHFGGAAPPSNLPTPAPVQFNLPGTYVITLEITGRDFANAPVNLYGERLITVVNPVTQFPPLPQPPVSPPVTGNATPEGFINSPADNITVRVGSAVLFAGSGFDPVGSGPLTFMWSFGGAVPNVISQNPGTVTFSRVGEYVVTLLVKNALGQYDPTPDSIVVSVTP